jgi:hypothetical protein
MIIQGPPYKEVDNKIFKFENKCYSYKTVAASCIAKDIAAAPNTP